MDERYGLQGSGFVEGFGCGAASVDVGSQEPVGEGGRLAMPSECSSPLWCGRPPGGLVSVKLLGGGLVEGVQLGKVGV